MKSAGPSRGFFGFGSVPLDSEEARAFLQRRVSLYALTLFILCFGFFVVLGLLHEIFPDHSWTGWTISPWNPFHLVTSLTFAAIWVLCHTGPVSTRVLGFLDAAGVLLPCTGYCIIAWSADPGVHIEYMLMLAVTNTLLARTVIVPSRWGRTLWIGLSISIPVLVATYACHARDASPPLILDRILYVAVTVLWLVIAVSISVVTSRVIYGLQQQVRKATQLGQYTLEEKIGEGGMGRVYRASHAMLRRPTAIKLLAPHQSQERNLERFEREVQLTARLTHPNTVTVFDYGRTPDGVFYYAMELLDGAALDAVVAAGGPMEPARAVHILAQAAGALAEAHSIDLIHRDIKPSNIMLCEQGGIPDTVKLLDFGLVKDIHSDQSPAITMAGEVAGTPNYMPPESINVPTETDGRSDLYSLGAVGYFLLTGQHMFTGKNPVVIFKKQITETPPPPSSRLGADLPPDLDALIMACLEKEPDKRPQTAAELKERLLSLKDIGKWDAALARKWWEAHPEARRPEPAPLGTLGARPPSVTVDLRQRAERR